VRSKERNGFGSFADIDGFTLESVKAMGRAFRAVCKVDRPFDPTRAASLSLNELLPPLEVPTPWRNEWHALDQVGSAMQGFVQTLAHQEKKKALGLPRQIDGPRDCPLDHQNRSRHRPTRKLEVNVGKTGKRHAAPVHYHLTKTPAGTYTVRVTAMIARHLPDERTSREVLTSLLAFLAADLPVRAAAGGGTAAAGPAARPMATGAGMPQANQRVEAVLLAEKTKKGGWRAKWSPGAVELVGPVVNTADVPVDKKADDAVTLVVAINPAMREIIFRWPK